MTRRIFLDTATSILEPNVLVLMPHVSIVLIRDSGPDRLGPWNATIVDASGINMFYAVGWVEDCLTTMPDQPVNRPLGDIGPSCSELFSRAYGNCNNGGVGGYVDAGCLRYLFIGGK
ncbi:hypothetical protein Slin15195_G018220 [Septoria linicola]|uniref:Uncharacterized protein n=1 Tax=Septoria linicola TaxID=215465 RepID=A0A9Q9AKB5_9PEZI|nr:hypothetical protein Slin14017_G018280 [Septoria linicola]USW48503.1 hypothetical protein Slin15195_G018220 [Septoria linicola]